MNRLTTGRIPAATTQPTRRPYRPMVMTLTAFALILTIATIALPGMGLATDMRSGSDVKVEAVETITEDLYIGGGTVQFEGTAQRDVMIAAGSVTIDGQIAGSLNLTAGESEINGDIGGSLRVFGGQVKVTGHVGGDIVMAGGRLEITSSALVGGNVLMAGGQIDVRGRVTGDIEGYMGGATIGGTVNGSVDIRTSGFDLLNTARVTGPITYTSRSDATVADNAQLAQGITQQDLDPWGDGDNVIGRSSGSLLRTLWALVAGVLLVLLAPQLANRIGQNGKRILPSLLFGFLALFVVPAVAILLMVTIIGLPSGFILLVLFLVGLYLTQVFAGMAIGRFILPRRWNDGSRGFHLLAMTIGVLLIGATRFIPLPYVGYLITAIITIWGMGAAVMLLTSSDDTERIAIA